MKTTAERSIEALTWASVVIWLGFTLIMRLLDYAWLVMMVLGIILLSSAIYQRSRGWQTSLAIWVFGIWMAVFSVIEAVNSMIGALNNGAKLHVGLDVYLGIALVSMGVASALRFVQGSVFGGGAAAAPRGTAQRAYSGDPRPNTPRLLNEADYSSGYVPPSGSSRTGRRYGRAALQEQPTQLDQPVDDYGYDPSAQVDEAGGYAYDQPEPYGAQDVYEQQPPTRGYRTGQSGPYNRQARQDAYGQQPPARGYRYDQPQYEQQDQYGYDQAAPQPQAPRQPLDRRRAVPQRRRAAQPAAAPSDLEARVEDIIRRSRERRNLPPDNLPY